MHLEKGQYHDQFPDLIHLWWRHIGSHFLHGPLHNVSRCATPVILLRFSVLLASWEHLDSWEPTHLQPQATCVLTWNLALTLSSLGWSHNVHWGTLVSISTFNILMVHSLHNRNQSQPMYLHQETGYLHRVHWGGHIVFVAEPVCSISAPWTSWWFTTCETATQLNLCTYIQNLGIYAVFSGVKVCYIYICTFNSWMVENPYTSNWYQPVYQISVLIGVFTLCSLGCLCCVHWSTNVHISILKSLWLETCPPKT